MALAHFSLINAMITIEILAINLPAAQFYVGKKIINKLINILKRKTEYPPQKNSSKKSKKSLQIFKTTNKQN